MRIQLSDHFSYGRLIRFTLPPIAMMLFTSIYGMVDGYFVSNFVGKSEFAALNLIWPYPMVLGAVGYMIGTGGTALVSKTLGEGRRKDAKEYFSLLIYSALAIGILLALLGLAFMRPVAHLLGAEGDMLEMAVSYGSIIMAFLPAFMLQVAFQSFMVAAEKPTLGFWVTVASGGTNMLLDWLLIGVMGGGLEAAAWATIISQLVGCIWPLIYFSRPNGSLLSLGRFSRDIRAFGQACFNGMSELVSNLAVSLVSMVYNLRLLRLCGENGVASYGVIMYVVIFYMAIYFGYSIGVSPVISYHYGAENHKELRNLKRRSLVLLASCSVGLTLLSYYNAGWVSRIFTGYDSELCALAERALALFSFTFLLCWFNVFASAFFTALNDGKTSAIISFLRLGVFQMITILLLPEWLGVDGVWLAMPAAELMSAAVSLAYLIHYKKRYKY